MDTPAWKHHPFRELRPASQGIWQGILSEDVQTGVAVLTWSIDFGLRPEEYAAVGLEVDSIPFAVSSWRELEGAQAECHECGEPVEAYLFDGEHSGFDYVRVQALHQTGTMVQFAVDLAECEVDRVKVDPDKDEWVDIDRLRVVVDAEFVGISVRTPNHRLADFTDTTGLVFDASCDRYRPIGD